MRRVRHAGQRPALRLAVQSGHDGDLSRPRRHHPAAARRPRRDAAVPDRTLRQPVVGARAGSGRACRARRGARAGGPVSCGAAPRDHLHLWRHGGDQPRDQGCRLGGQSARPPHRDQRCRAPRRRSCPGLPCEVRVRDRRVARRSLWPHRSGRGRGGGHRAHDPRVGDAGQQRGRHDPARRRDRGAGCDRTAGSCSMSTPSRPRRISRSTSMPWRSTCSRSRPTSSRDPRARGRCTCATAPTSWPSSMAAPRSAIDAPGPRTLPGPSGSLPPSSSPARNGPGRARGCYDSASGSRPPCSRSRTRS